MWHDEFYGLIVCCDNRSRESLVRTICSFKEIDLVFWSSEVARIDIWRPVVNLEKEPLVLSLELRGRNSHIFYVGISDTWFI